MTTHRPGGVVVAAVVLGLMALLGIFGSLISVATTFFLRLPGMPEVPGVRAVMAITAALMLCFFLFCGWTVVGLFRMRAWARYAILAIGGIEFCFCALMSAAMILVHSAPPPVPVGTPSPVSMGAVLLGMAAFYGFLSLIGAWWLVYFNLRPVRAAFSGTTQAVIAPELGESQGIVAQPQAGMPGWRIFIVVWACLMLLSPLYVPLIFLMHVPLFLFGFVLRGTPAMVVVLVLFAVQFYLGVGLLKKWKPAWYVALAWQVYTLVFFLTFFLPGVWTRFMAYQQEIQGSWLSRLNLPTAPPVMDMRPFMAMGMALGAVMVGLLTWALVERRGDYLHP